MKRKFMFKMIAATMAAASPAMAQTMAPAAPPTPPAAAAAPPSPLAQDAVAALDKVCLPALHGAKVGSVAPAAGFKLENGAWSHPIDGQRRVDIDPPDVANPHLCTVTVTSASGAGGQLLATLGAWARAQIPPLAAVQIGQTVTGSDLTTSQWSGQTSGGAESVVLSQKPAQGAGALRSTLMVSLSPT